MYPDGPNPCQVQSRPREARHSSAAPLVLLHDGGGTTFGFWILESLHRDVWAIHNPHFWNGQPWEGGMDEMARHYIDLLQKAGISGKILLGGWSLGGFLSLAMARMLAEDRSANINVAGLVLIDSPYHVPWFDSSPSVSEPVLVDVPPLVQKAFDYCDVLLRSWALPSWDGPACEGRDVHFAVGGSAFEIKPGTVLYKPLEGEWNAIGTRARASSQRQRTRTETSEHPVLPPPAVMLRCVKRAATAGGASDPCRVDLPRDDALLGWEDDYPGFIKAVLELDSDHYTVFDKYNRAQMAQVTSLLNQGLEILESLEVSDM
ncbi:alpha/beta-hydrolase [Zopfia rhizophila CBS 207.26]|uniref:Alpha/beta-hydrolase n=1 Tax=Zopfia rhizophila CBS 207.26 TaxID=1314779 RepID=A0A6A6DCS8_9PEZI|nr:alpha/beta-hydrolase [Zopfia rhizophila CBS 207.26]